MNIRNEEWVAKEAVYGRACVECNGQRIAEVFGMPKEKRLEYAAAIAALPDLLQVAEGLLGYLRALPESVRPDNAWFTPAQAAIDKASGKRSNPCAIVYEADAPIDPTGKLWDAAVDLYIALRSLSRAADPDARASRLELLEKISGANVVLRSAGAALVEADKEIQA